MKRIIPILCTALALVTTSACNHNRVDEPNPKRDIQSIPTANMTISELKALYSGAPTAIHRDAVIEATVISDDTEGNLYRSCYIADATGGLELRLGMANISTLYPQGTKIYLKAQGMTLGAYAGQVNLGYKSNNPRYETGYYPEKLVPLALITADRRAVSPIDLTIPTLSQAYAGRLIRLQDVQFLSSELEQTYADPVNKQTQSNVNRTLQDRAGNQIILRTSSYARFAGNQVATGSGNITAILTYFRDTPQLLLLRQSDVQMNGVRF